MIHRQPVQEVLAEWREVERQLETAADPAAAIELQARIEQLRQAYHAAVADAAGTDAAGADAAGTDTPGDPPRPGDPRRASHA